MAKQTTDREFFASYDLVKARQAPARKEPASHQSKALKRLDRWYDTQPFPNAGGILVLPTGGGKTFTAIRFLCRRALTDGYKVLWLAHTHHLLEQAYGAFDDGVASIGEPKTNVNVRVVSGVPGHYPVHSIKATDDVVIGTLQTIGRAVIAVHPALETFLEAAQPKLLIVFGEAHHSPAPSYRSLVFLLRQRFAKMYLLGLTATPTYTDEMKKGWLATLFPQGILHQVPPQELMAARVLAKPIFEEPKTNVTPEFDDREYQKWLGTHHDLPEDVITQLAMNKERNLFIANYYVNNKERFEKTIIFADRWFQCEQISEFLQKRGVKTGTVYSHIDADPGSAEARNKRRTDGNAVVLRQFREGTLDVLLNVRMLTEGTDVPKVTTVFLTRATTSQILLTQMVGRALRGPAFGGTEKAYIVSFIDNWRQLINWAEYDQLAESVVVDKVPEYGKRPPLQLISIELVQRLARQMDSGINMTPGPYVSLLPVGWYRVEYQTQVAGTDDLEPVRELVMVFESERESYQTFIEHIDRKPLPEFESEDVILETAERQLCGWRDEFFPNYAEHFGTNLLQDLLRIARHRAQNGVAPKFFPFEDRDRHNLDLLAVEFVEKDLGASTVNHALIQEYNRPDRLWSTIYYRYDLFKSQYDACVNRILRAKMHGDSPDTHRPTFCSVPPDEQIVPPEPSDELKRQVIERDGCCLCCGSVSRRGLQVDHISPRYYGRRHTLDNLQTLCGDCNRAKGTATISFLTHGTVLSEPPTSYISLKPPTGRKAVDLEHWRRYVCRSINFFYQCAATHLVDIGRKGDRFYHWYVELKPGNDPRWIETLVRDLLIHVRREREGVGYGVPNAITVAAPGYDQITVNDGSR